MTSSPYVLGIDIGGTNTRLAVAAREAPARFLAHRSFRTPSGVDVPRFLAFLSRGARECLEAADVPRDEVGAVGCASPGIIDAEGRVQAASNLGWRDVPLADLLADAFEMPATVENDVRAAALAEHRFGAGRGSRSLVYFTVSTGISCGILVDGQLVRGRHFTAGEIGRLLVDPAHVDGDWEPNGALETCAGGTGLAAAWAAHSGDDHATAADVFRRARDGHLEAVRLVERAATYLAQAAVAIGALLDPDLIVLGGGIARHEPLIAARIRTVTARALHHAAEVVLAALDDGAPLTGALARAVDVAAVLDPAVAAARQADGSPQPFRVSNLPS